MIIAILAGGRGTRLKKILKNKPKSLAEINEDTPFLKLQLDYFSKYKNIKSIYLLTSNFESQIKKYVKSIKHKYKFKIKFSSDIDKNSGTGGALKNFIKKIKDDFILIYGDTYPIFNLTYLLRRINSKKTIMVIFKNNNLYDYSNIKINREIITKYDKSNVKNDNFQYIDYGIIYFKYDHLKDINTLKNKKFDLSLYLENLILNKKLSFLITKKRFYEIGKIESYKEFIYYYNNSYVK